MSYYKKVMYIDYYENGERIINAGFLKFLKMKEVEKRFSGYGEKRFGARQSEERMCMQIHITNLPGAPDYSSEVMLINDMQQIWLGMLEITNGRGMLQVKDLEREVAEAAVIWDEESEAMLRVNLEPGKYLMCRLQQGSSGIEAKETAADKGAVEMQKTDAAQDVKETELIDVITAESEAEIVRDVAADSEVETAYDIILNNGLKMRTVEGERISCKSPYMQRDKWKQLWEELPHTTPFQDEREYLVLDVKDMVILPKMYYRLAENSFLLHGYYNYEHLILAKVFRKGVEKYYIGVPGNYYEKEKQVAVYFGFESFEPKTEPAGEGDFGYYMISVDI